MSVMLGAAFAATDAMWLRREGERLRALDAAHCIGAARWLAPRLPPRAHAIQACTDTRALALGTLAAFAARQRVIMPSTKLAADIAALARRFPDSYVQDAALLEAAASGVGAAHPDPLGALLERAPPSAAALAVEPDDEAVTLFTSGSTGEPRAHRKTFDALLRGAETFRAAFAPLSERPCLVGTVDCHHMFGLEASLMASLVCGYPLVTDRPQLPADFADAVAAHRRSGPGPLWLVTTPLQLAAFHRAGVDGHGVERVIVATMPLDVALARDVERDWGAQVDEIYGSTECGVMATRRPTRGPTFRPAPGIVFSFGADGEGARVARLPDPPAALDDRLRPLADGTFELLGRASDMVKVAGKRASLAALDLKLRAIAGVHDGAFFLARDDAPRLAAAVVAPGMCDAALRAALAKVIDAAFLPRPLIRVERLPRDAHGKLPRDALRALASAPGVRVPARAAIIEATRTFDVALPVFAGHFPQRPIVPGAFLLAALERVLREHGYAVQGCETAKFLRPVAPGERCAMRLDMAGLPRVRFEVTTDGACARGALRCVAAR